MDSLLTDLANKQTHLYRTHGHAHTYKPHTESQKHIWTFKLHFKMHDLYYMNISALNIVHMCVLKVFYPRHLFDQKYSEN